MPPNAHPHSFLQHPARVVALVYILLNLIFWSFVGGGGVSGGAFASVFSGSINALLVLGMSYTQVAGRAPVRERLVFCAWLLFALFPVSLAIAAQLHTDAQAALAIIFVGGLASAVHLALSLLLIAVGVVKG